MVILTLNCGSSSAKFQVYDWTHKEVLGKGMVERIGLEKSKIEISSLGKEEYEATKNCPDHNIAIAWIIETILDPEVGCLEDIKQIAACGHRIVQGGNIFTQSVIIDDKMIKQLEKLSPLAPLHTMAHIAGIRGAIKVLPQIPQTVIMDTAWHQTMPETSYRYAVPNEWYTKYHVRKYGFHGTSFLYTAKRAAVLLGKKPEKTNLIICHIGNGASISCVKNGEAFDTTMGLTPLEGLVMGTRCGDIDPAVVAYMCTNLNVTAQELDVQLNKKCGVLGISGKYSDRRDIQMGVNNKDASCILAQQMEAYRIKKYIGAYAAVLGKVDAIVFTAGVGEMNPDIRELSLSGLENFGIKIDKKKNRLSRVKCAETLISAADSNTKIFVIPTDEELVMTEDTYALLAGTYDVHTRFTYSFQKKSYVNKEREAKLQLLLKKDPKIRSILALQPQPAKKQK